MNNQWCKLNGKASDVAVGGEDSVWCTGTNNVGGGKSINKYNFVTGQWEKWTGGAVSISVDKYGCPWVVNDQGKIYRWNSLTNKWKELPGRAVDIACSKDSDEVFVTTKTSIFKWDEPYKNWVDVGGSATNIACSKGKPYVINNQGIIYWP